MYFSFASTVAISALLSVNQLEQSTVSVTSPALPVFYELFLRNTFYKITNVAKKSQK
jgi:hypothetical protein